MARLVHLTASENKRSILKSGIKPGWGGIVYFMPHMREFLLSHQWARELKRFSFKNCLAVDFKIPNDESTWFGRYNTKHQLMPLGEAIQAFMAVEDKLGYEFFIERKIAPREILKTRNISKPIGWRYEPHAHGKEPCPCPACLQRGGYKTNRLREKPENLYSRKQARKIIANSDDNDELYYAILAMQGKWRRESPDYLQHLLNFDDEYLLYELTKLLMQYRHPLAKTYLLQLSKSPDEDIRDLTREYFQTSNHTD